MLTWPGSDLGSSATGYSSPNALGELVLQKGGDIERRKGRLAAVRITGATTNNAIYIRQLTLSDEAVAELEDFLLIDPNITVYFAATSTNVAPEVLDGFITGAGGKLVYLPASVGGDGIVLRAGLSSDGSSLELSWEGAPSANYRVESRSLTSGEWIGVGDVKNTSAKSAKLKLSDSLTNGSGKLYRVVKGN